MLEKFPPEALADWVLYVAYTGLKLKAVFSLSLLNVGTVDLSHSSLKLCNC